MFLSLLKAIENKEVEVFGIALLRVTEEVFTPSWL